MIPFAGLVVISDTPLTAALTPNPLLIDGNLTASAGIDLGTAGTGPGRRRPGTSASTSSTPTEVNRLLVWVDRELPAEIASTFSWEIYSSPDNLTWTRETTVAMASVRPVREPVPARLPEPHRPLHQGGDAAALSAALPDASRYPDIFVTELQPFVTQSAARCSGRLKRTTQIFNTDVRLRLVDALLYYEGSYWYTDVSTWPARRHPLERPVDQSGAWAHVLRLRAGCARAGQAAGGDRVANVDERDRDVRRRSARSRSSLLYTGLNERIDDRPNDRQGVAVQTNAQLYRGVDVQFGFGWNLHRRGRPASICTIGSSTSAPASCPRHEPDADAQLRDTTTTDRARSPATRSTARRTGYLTLAVDPLRTLHLVLGEELVAVSDEKTRTTHNIGANWAPFPDGSLQFIVAYNEALRALEFGTERIFRPGVRWTFSRQSYVDVSYQRIAASSCRDDPNEGPQRQPEAVPLIVARRLA